MKLRAILAAMACVVARPVHAGETVSHAAHGGAYQEGVRKAILDLWPADHDMTVVDYVLSEGTSDARFQRQGECQRS